LLARLGVGILPRSPSPLNELLAHDPINGTTAGETVPLSQLLPCNRVRLFRPLSPQAQRYRALNQLVDAAHRVHGDGIALVETADARRACLLPFDLADIDAWGFAVRRLQWRGIFEFLKAAPDALPVWIDNAYEVWPLVYRRPGDSRLWVGLINFGYDSAEDATCWIAWPGPAHVRYVTDRGELRTVPSSRLARQRERIGIALRGENKVSPLDVRLLVVEPRD